MCKTRHITIGGKNPTNINFARFTNISKQLTDNEKFVIRQECGEFVKKERKNLVFAQKRIKVGY